MDAAPSPSSISSAPSAPVHVAIIMDGNGRWATRRGLPRTAGHKEGAEAVRRTVEAAAELGIPYLTLFGFSSENWKRPRGEVEALMGLLRLYLRREVREVHRQGVRLRFVGQREGLAADIVALMEEAEKLTADNTRLTVTIALNYGGRQEIVAAARRIAAEVAAGRLVPEMIDEEVFEAFTFTDDLPDPDLVIRTSGEQRVSNFLLWQIAYSELMFVDTLWPDFSRRDLESAIQDFHGRERRYGAAHC